MPVSYVPRGREDKIDKNINLYFIFYYTKYYRNLANVQTS